MTDELYNQESNEHPKVLKSKTTQPVDTDVLATPDSITSEQSDSAQQSVTKPKELIQLLSERFPNCFSVKGPAKPLKIGIFNDLVDAFVKEQPVSKTLLRSTLRHYTNSWRYLAAVTVDKQRVNLQGEEVEPVDAEQAEYAATRLQESKALAKQQRVQKKSTPSMSNNQQAEGGASDHSGVASEVASVQTKDSEANSSSNTRIPQHSIKKVSTGHRRSQQHRSTGKHGSSKSNTNLKTSPASKDQDVDRYSAASLDELVPGGQVFMTQGAKPIAATVVERNKDSVTVETAQGFTVKVSAQSLRVVR